MERDKFLEKTKEGCPFCHIHQNPHAERRKDVVVDSPNFVTIIDIAPPTDFYFVTFPKFHRLSYFEMPEEYEEEFNEVARRLFEVTGQENFIFFENGAGNKNARKQDAEDFGVISHQSVYHCHLNMVFLPQDEEVFSRVIERFRKAGLNISITNPDSYYPVSTIKAFTVGEPYFYIRQGRQAAVVIDEEKRIPSQFIRRTVSEVFNRQVDDPFWDWKNIDPAYMSEIIRRREEMKRLFI